MNRKSKVSEIMAEKLIVADAHNSFTQIMDFFTRSKIHHLPITQNNKIIGIVSLSDIIRYLGRVLEEGKTTSISEISNSFSLDAVMTKNPYCLKTTDTIESAFEEISKGGFHALPIIQEDETLVGIVTAIDLVRWYDQVM
ncbi:MAG TPA: CBS domain-containing protein [Ferruginibacter sp.]|jgi:CBS domain-containing protein|nr:CBS domain-containing protein [Bacteroidota bacterium]MCC6692554.1 CBS domain-containing protein [Chitinophagaceae bacterium]HMT95292.1 CBS domain-containing protein [Ferruginibacter sp.]MBS1924778.1 CBS domain-containing protein [Bacteroidota bacterium]HMU25463.1 CBS domain-containing protein [Ferruginibacter sp.]